MIAHNPVLKIAVSSMAALLATTMCFYLMNLLVSVHTRPQVTEQIRISAPLELPFYHEKTRQVRRKPQKILPTEPPPGPDTLPQFPEVEVAKSEFVNVGSLAETLVPDAAHIAFAPPIKDIAPLLVVQPVYPFKALIKEIEGHVVVQFTVKEDGTVLHPFVVESEPDDVFDDAALKAIRQFHFQPRQAGGDPLMAQDVRMRFAFQLKSPYEE